MNILRERFSLPKSQSFGYNAKRRTTAAVIAAFRYILIVSMAYVIVYPLLYMIVTSLRTAESFSDPDIVWVLKEFTIENFKDAFVSMDFLNCFKNTLVVQIISALVEIVSCSVVAYGISRFDFKFKKIEMIILIMTIVIPPQMIIIPNMMNFSRLDFLGILGLMGKIFNSDFRINVLDTPLTFYLPSIFGVGLRSGIMIFIYIQFFKGLPRELEEAASIDGAGPIKTFIKIAVPSSGVVFLTVSIFSIVWHWNDYYLSAMYMNQNKPLAVALANFPDMFNTLGLSSSGRGNAILMAASLMFVLPMLLFYLILQRKFVQSIDRVGITG